MPLTIELLFGLIAAFVTVAGAIGAMWKSLTAAIREAEAKTALVEKELADYKLQVAKDYASTRHIKEVEERLVKAVDKLTETIGEMPQKIIDIINSATSTKRRSTVR